MDKQLTDALGKLTRHLDALASPWLTPAQAAHYMHKRESVVTQMIRSGRLESRRDPDSERGTLVHRDWCDALILSWDSGAKTSESLRG